MKAGWIVVAGMAVAAVVALRGCERQERVEVRERVVTKVERDTVVVERPVAVARRVVDTVIVAGVDSVEHVAAAREQVEYSGEDYRAWVSGIEPRLDSVRVYSQRETTVIERQEATKSQRERRWSLNGGVALTPAGPHPFVSVGFRF